MHSMLMDLLHGFEVLSTTEETLFNNCLICYIPLSSPLQPPASWLLQPLSLSYFVINEIFISQTFHSITVLKKVKRCKTEVIKTRVYDLSIIIIKLLLNAALSRLIMIVGHLKLGKIQVGC